MSRLDGREDEIRHFLTLGVSKSSIAKITGVARTTLYNFITTRGLKAGPVFCLPGEQRELMAGLAISFSMWQCGGHGDAAGPGFLH